MNLARYLAGVPKRYHDVNKYVVHRTLQLELPPGNGHVDLKVFDVKTGGLAWAKG